MAAHQLVIGTGNEEQAAAWDGDEGRQWAQRPAFYDAGVRRHHARLMEAAAVGAADRVLDLGCGNGQTTRDAARAAAAGSAFGVDLSSPMIDRARARGLASHHANVAWHATARRALPQARVMRRQ